MKRLVILQDEQLVVREIARTAKPVASFARGRRRACRTDRSPPNRRTSSRSTTRSRPPPMRRQQRITAGRYFESRGDKGRARDDRRDASAGTMEPAEGRRTAWGELQDAAQQDQRVRHQSASDSIRSAHLTSRQLLPAAIWRAKHDRARAYASASAPADTGCSSSLSRGQDARGSGRRAGRSVPPGIGFSSAK